MMTDKLVRDGVRSTRTTPASAWLRWTRTRKPTARAPQRRAVARTVQPAPDKRATDILTKADFEALMAKSGISNDTHIVLYGDNNNWFAAYALWLTELYGHEKVSLMNGGRVKWLADNRPTTTAEPSVPAVSYTAKEPNPALRAVRDEVLQALKQPVHWWTCAAPRELPRGDRAPGMSETAQRGGHIPGRRTSRGRAP